MERCLTTTKAWLLIIPLLILLVVGCQKTDSTPGELDSTPTVRSTLMTPADSSFTLSENEAVSKAIEHARFCGLKGQPSGYTSRLMTLGEYAKLTGASGPEPEKPVWVVSLRGRIDWSCPAPPMYIIEEFVVVVDAQSGFIIGTGAYESAEKNPFPVR